MRNAGKGEKPGLSTLHRQTRAALAAAGVAEPALDARLLVEHFTGTTRTEALVSPERPVPPDQVDALRDAVARRIEGEPVHRILGFREFYGLRLQLSADTLEPRPDTEALVDLVLPFARQRVAEQGAYRILDLGTGTGAIALALLRECPGADALGTDISTGALAIAARNADINGVATRFSTLRSDWFDKVDGRFDLIVSNPPYIATHVLKGLQREVRDFDPRAALDGGEDGLDAYRVIAAGCTAHLEAGGLVAVETGYDQRQAVSALFAEAGFVLAGERRDLAGNDRALAFRMRELAATQAPAAT